jgi:hypothetical protein
LAEGVGDVGVAELAEGAGFDLADALAGEAEALADLFEGVDVTVSEAEAHLENEALAAVEGTGEGELGLLTEDVVLGGFFGRALGDVHDEIADAAVVAVAVG